jgi:DNA-directed RNA polymerase alpha subunit
LDERDKRIAQLEALVARLETESRALNQTAAQVCALFLSMFIISLAAFIDGLSAQQRDKEQAQLARLASQYERTLSEVRSDAQSKFDAYEASISQVWDFSCTQHPIRMVLIIRVLLQAEQRRAAEMDEIETKVRSITSKKDDQIAALREALRARDARVLQIETLLEHQRQELGGM